MRLGIALWVLTFVAIGLLLGVAEPSTASNSQTQQQLRTGVVLGRIQDGQGAALPGVTVTLEREGMMRQAISDASGRYSIGDVPPGMYRVEMALPGFRPFTRTDVVVIATSTTTVDGKLRINMGHSPLAPNGIDATDPAAGAHGVRGGVAADLPERY